MKKLVAISVLFAGLATAVFAQDGGWSNAWKIGLSATFITDMFYTAHASGKAEQTVNTDPVTPSGFASDGTNTWSNEYGKYYKGVTHFFPNKRGITWAGDNRVELTMRNTGENYDMLFNITIDDWANNYGGWSGKNPIQLLLDGNQRGEWGIKGNAGIFSAGVGPWAVDGAPSVDANAVWGTWTGMGDYNRYGLVRWSKDNSGKLMHSDHIRSLGNTGTWGEPFAVGVKLGDAFKFTLGYNFSWGTVDLGGGKDSRSSMNGVFMFSGSPADAISFDLFYAIQGKDEDTLARPGATPGTPNFGYSDPKGSWQNLIGAYVQVKGIENLFLSVGYTVNFNVFEAGGFLCSDGDFTQSKVVTYNAPIYSGIDLRLGFSGIDKVGLKFNNNFSFAGVNGDKLAKDTSDLGPNHVYVYKDKINLLLDEEKVFKTDRNAGDGLIQSWFHWTSVLSADLGFIEGVGLNVSVSNLLGVTTNKVDRTDVATDPVTGRTDTTKNVGTRTDSRNDFRVGVKVSYPIGNVSLGVGLLLNFVSDLSDISDTITYTSSDGRAPSVVKVTKKKNDDEVKFGVPILFKVSF